MHPQTKLKHSHVGPEVADLLLARAPHFLHVVKVLFDRGPVGEGFQNLHDAGRGVGREQSEPTTLLLHQHHSDYASHRAIGRQERLGGLDYLLAIQRTQGGLPTTLLSGSLGQTDFVLAVLAWTSATTLGARTHLRRQVP